MKENVELGHTNDNEPEETHTFKGSNKPKLERSKSVRDKIRDARDESDGIIGFCGALVTIIVGALAGIACIGICIVFNLIPIAMIVVGAVHMHDCPIRKGIPIALVVNGVLIFISSVCRGRDQNNENANTNNSFTFASTVCFIALCVLVYGSDKPQYDDPNDPFGKYCDKSLYLFSLWFCNITMGFMVLVIIILILICCFAICGNK